MNLGIYAARRPARRSCRSSGAGWMLIPLAFSLALALPPSWAEPPWRAPPRARVQRNPLPRSAVAKGAPLFASHCSPCHGVAGRGDGFAAAAMNPPPRNLTHPDVQRQTDGALFWKISSGRGAMPAWSWLQPQERWALVWVIRELARPHDHTRQGAGGTRGEGEAHSAAGE